MKEYLISGFKLDAFRLINARIIVEYKKIYSNKNTICLLIGSLLKKRPAILNMPKKGGSKCSLRPVWKGDSWNKKNKINIQIP